MIIYSNKCLARYSNSVLTALQVLVLAAQLCSVDSLRPPWTVARQAPLSMELSRQEYWGGLPLPSPGDLPNPGIEPGSPILQADSFLSEAPGKP